MKDIFINGSRKPLTFDSPIQLEIGQIAVVRLWDFPIQKGVCEVPVSAVIEDQNGRNYRTTGLQAVSPALPEGAEAYCIWPVK